MQSKSNFKGGDLMKLQYFMIASLFLATGMIIEAKPTGSNLVKCSSNSQCPYDTSCVNGICLGAGKINYETEKSMEPSISRASQVKANAKAKLKNKMSCTSNSQCKSDNCVMSAGQTSGMCAAPSKAQAKARAQAKANTAKNRAQSDLVTTRDSLDTQITAQRQS